MEILNQNTSYHSKLEVVLDIVKNDSEDALSPYKDEIRNDVNDLEEIIDQYEIT